MTNVSIERTLNASPEAVWDVLRGFGFPYFKGFKHTVKGQGLGATRAFEMPGGPMAEKIVAYDEDARMLSWEITVNPWPVTSYLATVQVTEAEAGALVVFSAAFEPAGAGEAEASEIVSGTFKLNLKSLERYLSSG